MAIEQSKKTKKKKDSTTPHTLHNEGARGYNEGNPKRPKLSGQGVTTIKATFQHT